ncbi:solute carrier family 49 member A3 isoform X1 [Lissotriton helveticus]
MGDRAVLVANECPTDRGPILAETNQRRNELEKLAEYKTYGMRWYVLGVICLLNCSNAMLWLSFAPVADITAKFFDITMDQVNWLSQVYLIVAIPVGLCTMWVLDIMGLRTAVILGAWLNMLGSVIRFMGFLSEDYKSVQYGILLTGQCLCAVAQPLVLFSPTKLAAIWFPEHQRATANMIASMSNPMGVLVANLLSPALVHKTEDMALMMGIYAIPAVLACTFATGGVCHSEPLTPPSASAINSTSEPFCSGLKKLMTNKAYVILMVCVGAGIGIITAFSALLEQILCVMGYSNSFAGLCGALLIAFGLLGAFLLGLYIDRTKMFIEATKVFFCGAALASIAFALVSRLPGQPALVAVFCSLFGLLTFSIYPISMELAVECTYPVGEGTSTGLIYISGQIQGIIYMLLFQATTKQLSDAPLSTCSSEMDSDLDWKVPVLLMAGVMSVGSCFFVLCFHTDYKRLQAEAESAAITQREADSS